MFSPPENLHFMDLAYLLMGMFSNDLQTKGYYFMHASAVKYDDMHSMIFAGDPNAGKTSMAFNLVKNNRYKLISNDNVLVGLKDGKLVTQAGTKNVQMRYGALRAYFPELVPYFPIGECDKDKDEWDLRVIVDDYMRERGYEYANESVVTDVCGISTYNGGNSFFKGKSKIDQGLFMYEKMTENIRSCRHVLLGFDYPLPSFEREDLSKDRFALSQAMCENAEVYEAKGTVDELSRMLVKKITAKKYEN